MCDGLSLSIRYMTGGGGGGALFDLVAGAAEDVDEQFWHPVPPLLPLLFLALCDRRMLEVRVKEDGLLSFPRSRLRRTLDRVSCK